MTLVLDVTANLGRRSLVPVCVVLVGLVSAPIVVAQKTREAYLSALDPRSEEAASRAVARIQNGDTASGLRELQALLDDPELIGRLVRPPRLTAPGSYRVNVPVRRELRRLLLALPDEAIRHYRQLYDDRADALRTRALEQRDPRGLWACYARYPAATCGTASALDAADLFFEQGRVARARHIWSELEQVETARAATRAKRAKRAESAETIAEEDGADGETALRGATAPTEIAPSLLDRLRRRSARAEAELSDTTTSASQQVSQTTGPGRTLPRLPFTRGSVKLAWTAETEASQSSNSDDAGVNYLTRPVVSQDEIAVPTFEGLYRFARATGQPLGIADYYPHDFDRNVVNRPTATLPGDDYAEVSTNLDLAPISFADGTCLTQYVAWMNPRRGSGSRGRIQEVSIPRRSLALVHTPSGRRSGRTQVVWETHRHPDPKIRSLSFNSAPLAVGDEILALGWRWSGYTDVFLCCFDRRTGALRFSTLIVSNQVELTRFGFMACEPFLGQVSLEDDTVFVNTNMGAVASVDYGSGQLRWLTEYFPVRPPRDMHFRRRMMQFPYEPELYWRHAAPAVSTHRVHFTPQDSPNLISCDRSTGVILQTAGTTGYRTNHLVGRWRDSLVYFNGDEIVLVNADDYAVRSVEHDLEVNSVGRPVLYRDGLLYLTTTGLRAVQFDLERGLREIDLAPVRPGQRATPIHWGDGPATITILESEVIVTTPYRLYCYRVRAL